MLKLLIENLLHFKIYYAISIITLMIGIALIHFIGTNDFFIDLFIALIILAPEMNRIGKITTNGYLKLINKLPLNKIEIYTHKYVVSIFGLLFIQILAAISLFIFNIPHYIFDRISFISCFLYASILVQNTTNLFSKSTTKFNKIWTISSFTLFVTIMVVFSLLFKFMTDKDYTQISEWHRPINYIIYFSLQAIIGYIIGRIELRYKND